MRRGNDVVLQPGHDAPVLVNEELVQYRRGDAFVEEYALAEGEVEQRFVFLAPAGGTGDLVIEGNLTGDLRPVLEPNSGEITFRAPGTDEVLASYGRAIVEDAAGRRLAARLELEGAHLRIVVPGEWLAQATYPLVVDPLIGINFAVSTQPVQNDQAWTAAAYGGNGASLVAWADYRSNSSWDVYGQLLTAEGMLLSPTIAVCALAGNQSYPDVAADGSGAEYLVVWQAWQSVAGSNGWDIRGQRVTGAGGLQGGVIELYSGPDDQVSPTVAYDSVNDRYLAVWQEYSGGRYRLQGRLLEADGSLGSTFAITSSVFPLSYPDVAANPAAQEYLVVWQAGGAIDAGIAGRRVSFAGRPLGLQIDIAAGPGNQTTPAVACGAGVGQYLVVYQDAQGNGDVMGRRVKAGGGLEGEAFAIASGAAVQGRPDVTWGAALGEYLVTWETTAGAALGYDVHRRRVQLGQSGGLPAGDEVTIYSSPHSSHRSPSPSR